MANAAGNQIFVVVRRGKQYPPQVADCRVKYEQTVADIKKAAGSKLGVPVDKLLLFWQGKELTPAFDKKTLLELNLHTGFSLTGYDLTEEPDFWPPVIDTPEGRRIAGVEEMP
ncbi:ubiquitin [Micractinium conductrix]|uniref:Ubiquitin n=1 Tax=Micractinium conductrix TaxID=554055 RepID=A0A2P6V9U1_9CHLO|nr:ubiquitin [Micractinium conductrix]|eukprot:PSC70859.1 ubiquitin [Micractinium conductrix]